MALSAAGPQLPLKIIGRACRLSASRSRGTVSRCNSTKAFASLCKPSDKRTDATSTSFPRVRRCSANPDSIKAMGPCPIRSPNRPESYGNCIRDIEPIAHVQTSYYADHFPPEPALLRVGAVQMGIALAGVMILIARADGAQCDRLPHNKCEQRFFLRDRGKRIA